MTVSILYRFIRVALLACLAAPIQASAQSAATAAPPEPAAAGQAASSAELSRAYRREFAFLEAEKATLQRRVRELEQEAEQKLRAARQEIEALQGQVMGASLEADRLADTLLDVERQSEAAEEGDDVVDNLLTQAATTLEKGKIKLPGVSGQAKKEKAVQIRFAFDKSLGLLKQYGLLRTEPGSFFLTDGTKVEGSIVRVGNVAAYGVSDRGAGALAPAGGDALKVWAEHPSADSAEALAQGQAPSPLRIFLYESLDKAVEGKAKVSPVQHITSGGMIAWVIVGGGVLALLMIIARAVLLWRAAANTEKLVEQISPLVAQGNLQRAVAMCKSAKSAAGRVLRSTLEHLDRPREQLEDIISEAVLHEQPVLDRFGSAIMVLAAVSPLLGLLGTVTGMISTFDVITEFGTGNPKLLSGGISEALITTELGLIVAIPALLCGNLLSGWADSIKDGMDKSALRITNVVNGVSEPQPQVASLSARSPEVIA